MFYSSLARFDSLKINFNVRSAGLASVKPGVLLSTSNFSCTKVAKNRAVVTVRPLLDPLGGGRVEALYLG